MDGQPASASGTPTRTRRFVAPIFALIGFAVAAELGVFLRLDPLVGMVAAPSPDETAAFFATQGTAGDLAHRFITFLLLSLFLWLLLFGAKLVRARSRFDTNGPAFAPSRRSIALHLFAFAFLIAVRLELIGRGAIPVGTASGAMAAVYVLALAAFAASAMATWAPADFWRQCRQVAEQHPWRAAAEAGASFALAAPWFLGFRPHDIEPSYVGLLFPATANVVSALLRTLDYSVHVDAVSHQASVGAFAVQFDSPCLGYEGMAIAAVFLSVYLFAHRASMRFPQALAILPLAFAALFAANCVRLAMLLAIGASWSPQVALLGFHSVAGSISLLLLLIASIAALNLAPFFATKPQGFALDLATEKMQLVPQVVLLGVGLLSVAASAGFDWAYAARVIAAGAALLMLWPRLCVGKPSSWGVPVLVGVAVFAVWLALVPVEADQSSAFARTLFAAPQWIVFGWIAARSFGAVVVVPLAEELAFRGGLFTLAQRTAAGRHARWVAWLVTSVGFGLMHSAWLAGIVAGLGYGALRMYRDRVADAVVAHATTNLLLAGYVMATGAWSLW